MHLLSPASVLRPPFDEAGLEFITSWSFYVTQGKSVNSVMIGNSYCQALWCVLTMHYFMFS